MKPVAVSDANKRISKADLTRCDILDCATELFIERGLSGTSLQDVADAAGLTRPALYYHFRAKEEILAALVDEGAGEAAKRFRIAIQGGKGASKQLLLGAREFVIWILSDPARFLVIDRNENELPPSIKKIHEEGKRQVFRQVEKILRKGINDGDFRKVDPAISALSIIGMCSWSARWFDPNGRMQVTDVADVIGRQAVASVAVSMSDWHSHAAMKSIDTIAKEAAALRLIAGQ